MHPSKYYGLKRALLIAICALQIVLFFCVGLSNLDKFFVDHQEEGCVLGYDSKESKDELIQELKLIYTGMSLFILLTSFGLLGAWCHNLPLMYIFIFFLFVITSRGIELTLRDSDQWPIPCFFGAVLLVTAAFLADLYKMKRSQGSQACELNFVVQC